MSNRSKYEKAQGFTLVEVMVVVVILGILATVSFVAFSGRLKDANEDIARTGCRQVEDAIEQLIMRNPETIDMGGDEIMEKLIENGFFKGNKAPMDPWKQEFIIEIDDDGNPVVFSKGADRQEDTDDDVFRDGLRGSRDTDF